MARLSTPIHLGASSDTLQFNRHRAVNLSSINEATHTTNQIP